jgi:peptide/nickel transport system substrate-binding protein
VHLMRRRGAIVAAFFAGSLVLAACGGGGGDTGTNQQTAELKQGGEIIYAADQEPDSLQNNTSAGNSLAARTVTIAVLPQFYFQNPDYSVTLGHAFQSAEITNQDPQTLVIKIKPEAKWSDGTPISAKDLIYQWEHQNGSNPDFDTASTTGYEDIESITPSDNDKTATVVFKNKFSDWQSLWTDIMPAHALEAAEGGWNRGFRDTIPVSGGPFKIESHTRGQQLVLVRNDQFWGPKSKLDKIVYRFLPESLTQPQALINKEVHLIYPQPQADMVTQLKAQPDLVTQIAYGPTFEHLTFNFQNEHLGNNDVRTAIAKGVDREQIVQRTVGQFDSKGKVLRNRIFMNEAKEYEEHGTDYTQRDVAGAEQLLQKAGYAKGSDGIYAKDGKKLSLRISTTAGNALRLQQAELIQAQLKEVGIDIKITPLPADNFFGTALPEGDFDIGMFAWVGGAFPISSSKATYATGSDSNYGKYTNKQVDDLYNQANAELDKVKAAALANQADDIMSRELPNLPLYQKATFLAYGNQYGGIKDNPTNDSPLSTAYEWGLKAQAQ